jgi:hypothetical protein
MLHEKLIFHRDKSTFGALAVPAAYPCGPVLISDKWCVFVDDSCGVYDSWWFFVVIGLGL